MSFHTLGSRHNLARGNRPQLPFPEDADFAKSSDLPIGLIAHNSTGPTNMFRLTLNHPRVACAGLLAFCILSGCYSKAPKPVAESNDRSDVSTTSSANSVAVIDMDRVAVGIGAVEKMRDAMNELERKCLTELRQATAEIFEDHKPSGGDLAQFDAATAPLVANLPAEQQREFNKSLRLA